MVRRWAVCTLRKGERKMGLLDMFKKPTVADLQSRGDVDGIAKILHSQGGKQAMEAASALASMGGEKGVLALMKALMPDSSPDARLAGAMYLGMVSDANALPILVKAATDRKLPVPVRVMTILSIGRIGERGSLEPLISLVGDPDAQIRASAASALGDVGVADERATAALLSVCGQGRLDSRHAGTVALAKLKDPRALEFIRRLLDEEKDPGWRVEIIRALGELGGEEAILTLTALLESPNDRELSAEIREAINRAHK
jgi:HEAT repeat protein